MNDVSAVARSAPASELAWLTAHEMLAGYREGTFTPSDVVEDVIAALKRTDAACNIVVTDLYDSARTEAKRVTGAYRKGEAHGALAGVPSPSRICCSLPV